MRTILLVVLFLFIGIGIGFYIDLPMDILHTGETGALYLLLFLIGIGIGMEPDLLKYIRSINFGMFLLPMCVIAGSLIGAAAISFLLPELSIRESLLIGSGLGYYSLSSILITQYYSVQLGIIALISNILREVLTIITAPWLVRWFGRFSIIASGGATSMDITLPAVVKYSGKQYVVISIINGVVLSIMVPILVSIFL